ncbi:hypothetical protein GXB85_04685 [Cellulomonas sp. APG4]|uniref:hypothetical protein n=1 Tax=Cellulomonas sp. APG4 TaxID=1538656 RepID=UPI00137A3481|nr:hypothetical protein [Cellulomonas sp. APG4]NCT90250.1 hypothetical protein [Cellulomonas sp. APG4]
MSEPPPADERFVTQAELATFLKMTPTHEEATSALLSEVLDAALEQVELRVGPLVSASQTYVVYPNGRNLVLPATHLVSVGTVTDPHGNVVDADLIDTNLLSGIVTVPSTVAGKWTVQATTREHGASLKQAVKIIAAHLWESQRGRAGGGARAGAYTAAADADPTPKMGFALPRRALELIKPFTVPGPH